MSADANPWLPPQVGPHEGETSTGPSVPVTPPWQRPQLDAEAGGIPAPARRLGWWRTPRRLLDDVAWWAVGVHGGAGATRFVAAMNCGGYDVPQHWPVVPQGVARRPLVLVARTDLHGITAVQESIREWWWKLTPSGFDFAGLVLMADAPGRLPTQLRNQAQVLSGTVPRVWHIPWVPEWRVGEEPARPPKELAEVRSHLVALTKPAEAPPAPAHEQTRTTTTVTNWAPGRSSA